MRAGFTGIDSLYLVIEYPRRDVFDWWAQAVGNLDDLRFREGIAHRDMVIRRGLLGYKLSVWDGDARLLLTDRVDDVLRGTAAEGQGMGMMLQLGPKWLRRWGDCDIHRLKRNILGQLAGFGVQHPDCYPIRLNRVDIAVDVLGLNVAGFSIDTWRERWVGYAKPKSFHLSSKTGELEGLSVGTSSGAVRFKVYDKAVESIQRGTSGFWRSVWGMGDDEEVAVARFEWSVKCYEARFAGMCYLAEFSYVGLLELLNYVSLKWGRLCIPQPGDSNRSRWPLAALWTDLRGIVEDWNLGFEGVAKRDYDYRPDLKPEYLRSVAGWLSGLMVRAGLAGGKDAPASFADGLECLEQEGYSIPSIKRQADEKWKVLSRLAGRWGAH